MRTDAECNADMSGRLWRLRHSTGLKKLLADAMLDNAALKDLLAKNVWSAPALQGLSFCRRKQLA